MTGELNEQEINNVLSSQAIGHLACCSKNQPYVVPVIYTYDGKNIYGQSFEGKKIELMRDNPNVCFQVDITNNTSTWQSVLIFGQFEEQIGESEKMAREMMTNKILPFMTNSAIHQHEHDEGEGHELSDEQRIKPIMFVIKINEKSGRFQKI